MAAADQPADRLLNLLSRCQSRPLCRLPQDVAHAYLATRLVREASSTREGADRVQLDGGPLGPGLDEGKGVLMARKILNELLASGRSVWALIAIVSIAGCSAPVLRTPSLITAPAYDSPRCEDARRLDAQAATWWLPASCFKAASR
jgi:hypothetical protein